MLELKRAYAWLGNAAATATAGRVGGGGGRTGSRAAAGTARRVHLAGDSSAPGQNRTMSRQRRPPPPRSPATTLASFFVSHWSLGLSGLRLPPLVIPYPLLEVAGRVTFSCAFRNSPVTVWLPYVLQLAN